MPGVPQSPTQTQNSGDGYQKDHRDDRIEDRDDGGLGVYMDNDLVDDGGLPR